MNPNVAEDLVAEVARLRGTPPADHHMRSRPVLANREVLQRKHVFEMISDFPKSCDFGYVSVCKFAYQAQQEETGQ